MKLIKIHHYRCNELDGTTYLLAPDDYSDEQISEDAQNAADEHINSIKEFQKSNKPVSKYIAFENYPDDMTFKEARELQAKEKQEKWEYLRKERDAGQDFSFYMRKRGYKTLYDSDEIVEYTASWGHNHGIQVDYSETTIDYKPIKKILKE